MNSMRKPLVLAGLVAAASYAQAARATRPAFSCELLEVHGSGLHSWGWGRNSLASSAMAPIRQGCPVRVSGLAQVSSIEADGSYSLATTADGLDWGWGRNDRGQLGNGSLDFADVPGQIIGVTNASSIAAGRQHGLALLNDGSASAWGWDSDGQLATGVDFAARLPLQIDTLANVSRIGAGADHAVAVLADNTVWGWGDNGLGQVGDGALEPIHPQPVCDRNHRSCPDQRGAAYTRSLAPPMVRSGPGAETPKVRWEMVRLSTRRFRFRSVPFRMRLPLSPGRCTASRCAVTAASGPGVGTVRGSSATEPSTTRR